MGDLYLGERKRKKKRGDREVKLGDKNKEG